MVGIKSMKKMYIEEPKQDKMFLEADKSGKSKAYGSKKY